MSKESLSIAIPTYWDRQRLIPTLNALTILGTRVTIDSFVFEIEILYLARREGKTVESIESYITFRKWYSIR